MAQLNPKEESEFQRLFRSYCRQEINEGHCDPDKDCEFCSVNAAYDKIFEK